MEARESKREGVGRREKKREYERNWGEGREMPEATANIGEESLLCMHTEKLWAS
jgi:hypothetical protein